MAQPIWNTGAGTLGNFPSSVYIDKQLSASPILPAVTVSYSLLSGALPAGLSLSESGLIFGTPVLVASDIITSFGVRATDNMQNIRDRTFSMTISGVATPEIITPTGNLLSTVDSIWVEFPIQYINPISTNPITIRIIEGSLPPGLEMISSGLIRGYADIPLVNITLPTVIVGVTVTDDSTNIITCLSTTGFAPGRTVSFSGTSVFGGVEAGRIYYIKSISGGTGFTISSTQDGPILTLTAGNGLMVATLTSISIGQPTIRTYSFTVMLDSPYGQDTASYSITVINQNTPVSQNGPGYPANSRTPVIYNTRPTLFVLNSNDPYYGYYILPPAGSTPSTIPPSTYANIGTIQSDNYFAFKIIGHDFDGNALRYVYSDLPMGLAGDPDTGWIVGTPTLSLSGINQFAFTVAVSKVANPTIQSEFFKFSINVANEIRGIVTWITPTNLGDIFNGTISTRSVLATSDVELHYRISSGALPPNLTLLPNGEITGYVADQPSDQILPQGAVTNFTFVVQAYSPAYPVVQSSKTFEITVIQEYANPTDILYIKATPSLTDRIIIDSLLNNETLIPSEMLYRPSDPYFGKATSVIYEHAFGIYASDIDEYLAAITKNHYWRNITLGEIKTAVAKNDAGEIIYEVVYSSVIDNLQNLEVDTQSNVSTNMINELDPNYIVWARPIDLNLGPWYTSITDIYTSYDVILNQQYYTSLTSGSARILYPNSLLQMRSRISEVLGQEYNSNLLPIWMTSQQADGSTLGYTQAWVICYTKPGFGETIKNNLTTQWRDPPGRLITLNQINFKIDRFAVNKSITYNYDKNVSPPAWTGLPSATPVPDPIDSKDFYVLFPRKTILPDKTEY